MRADPIPHDFVAVQDSHRSIPSADPHRIDWPCRMDRLETKTRIDSDSARRCAMPGAPDVEPLQAVRRTFSGTAQWCARSQFFRIKLLSPPDTVLRQCLIG